MAVNKAILDRGSRFHTLRAILAAWAQKRAAQGSAMSEADRTPYRVLLLDDEQTPMEFVVYVLENFFDMEPDAARDRMLRIHNEGSAECGIYPHEEAVQLVADRCNASWRSARDKRPNNPRLIQTDPPPGSAGLAAKARSRASIARRRRA